MSALMIPRPPSHWTKWTPELNSGWFGKHFTTWQHKLTDMSVLRSISTTELGERWLHVSVSRPDRLPSWEDLVKVKREFIGENAEAYQVIPAQADYINIHPHCLHLWAPMDGARRVANLKALVMEEPA